jgi:hypothetical protein
MNDPISGLALMAVFVVAVGAVAGFYVDHQRRKYHALAEAERNASRQAGS